MDGLRFLNRLFREYSSSRVYRSLQITYKHGYPCLTVNNRDNNLSIYVKINAAFFVIP